MIKPTLLLTLLLAFAACHSTKECVEKINPDCVCTLQYDPVCGCNNKTYGNACAAECAGIKQYTKGECGAQPAAALEGVKWKLSQLVTSAGVEQVPANVDIHLQFDNGKVSGRGGCNTVGGGYTKNGAELTFSALMSTKMYCEQTMAWETKFLAALEKSQIYAINGQMLEITCGDKGTLVFKK